MTVQELKNQIHNEFAGWEDELMRKVAPVFPLSLPPRGGITPASSARPAHCYSRRTFPRVLLSIFEQIPLFSHHLCHFHPRRRQWRDLSPCQ
jgi:hypothetical protein